PGPGTCSLAATQSITCTASHSVPHAHLDGGSHTHAGQDLCLSGLTQVDSNEDSETATATQTPVLTLDKSSPDTTYDAVGDVLSYSGIVNDCTTVTVHAPMTVAADIATTDCSAADASLAPGASTPCS